MGDCHIEKHTRAPTIDMFDIKRSEYYSSKKQSKDSHKYGDEADPEYVWYLETLPWPKPTMEETRHEHEDEIENEADNEKEDEDDKEAKYKDPQYSMFLKQLTANGKSYKLKISKDDESPEYLEYEGPYDPTSDMKVTISNNGDKMEDMQISFRVESSLQGKKDEILMIKESSKKIITETQNGDPCYMSYLKGVEPSVYGKFKFEGKVVKYEEKITNEEKLTKPDADSDSEIQVWNKDEYLIEVNKQLPATKEPSLRRKLMRILEKPYNEEEYKELSKYIEEEKPIHRLRNLRGRVLFSAMDGHTKSVLDDGPESFRKKLKAVQNERPRALNLMRMFRFWLENLPNEKIFMPWTRKDLMEVLPSSRKRSHNASR